MATGDKKQSQLNSATSAGLNDTVTGLQGEQNKNFSFQIIRDLFAAFFNTVYQPINAQAPITVKVPLSSAQILALGPLGSGGFELVAPVGNGYFPSIISVTGFLSVSTPYATNTRIFIGAGAGYVLRSDADFLNNQSGAIGQAFERIPLVSEDNNAVENGGIYAYTAGNPTDGDETLDLYITYQKIQL